ncbi:hypothetical protein K413DRAFT_4657 [Clostridium sp. ASBs410]|nr:hypothetical protein K413DRAFT_4657 [Clostridium sp. ASBs410]
MRKINTSIKDYKIYNSGMKKSIKDKLFFEGLIDDSIDTFVDFGCADGQILAQVHNDFPEWKLKGIDNDYMMIELAKRNCKAAEFFEKITDIANNNTSLLNLSSVIHEVYSYSSSNTIEEFWSNVFNGGFKYISIRDLMSSYAINAEAEINDILKLQKRTNSKQLSDFISVWGNISTRRNLVHYLLKYSYVENWERELRENYLPITVECFLNMIPDTYEIIYFNHYILPFTKDRIKKDFDIDLRDNTHVKILLKRKQI